MLRDAAAAVERRRTPRQPVLSRSPSPHCLPTFARVDACPHLCQGRLAAAAARSTARRGALAPNSQWIAPSSWSPMHERWSAAVWRAGTHGRCTLRPRC
ncbi:hypothetical protein GUJ93_ZPchr0008g12778 [Zizania palustris]|uniref:Uncharacterized protein n=1 Tax=Zizania palustris TaxID=103762 RepID=A0A8J5R9N4_ZIZPA|nr:hypothetical protein GUJ93_ZPchr0008g12778 [Zizania palustris]